MQVIQTAADPPNQGRMSFEMRGWTRNSRHELARMVAPKRSWGVRDAGIAAKGEGVSAVAVVDKRLFAFQHALIVKHDGIGVKVNEFAGDGGVLS
jgi:hypothetical protein